MKKKQKKWILNPSKCLTTSQVKKVFDVINSKKPYKKRSHLIENIVINALFHTGMRRSELTNLKWRHIQLDELSPRIFIQRGKSEYSRRVIPINSHLASAIFEYTKGLFYFDHITKLPQENEYFLKNPSGNKYSETGIYRIFKRVMDETNIPHKNPHIARHTFAVDLYKRSGYNLRLVQETLGHSSIHVTEIYTHVSLHEVKVACNLLYQEILDP